MHLNKVPFDEGSEEGRADGESLGHEHDELNVKYLKYEIN